MPTKTGLRYQVNVFVISRWTTSEEIQLLRMVEDNNVTASTGAVIRDLGRPLKIIPYQLKIKKNYLNFFHIENLIHWPLVFDHQQSHYVESESSPLFLDYWKASTTRPSAIPPPLLDDYHRMNTIMRYLTWNCGTYCRNFFLVFFSFPYHSTTTLNRPVETTSNFQILKGKDVQSGPHLKRPTRQRSTYFLHQFYLPLWLQTFLGNK